MTLEIEKARLIFDSIKNSGSTARVSSVAVSMFDTVINQGHTAAFGKMLKIPNSKKELHKKKGARNSANFIKTLTFYSFMQGFFIRARSKVTLDGSTRTSDFYQACTNIIDLSGGLFDAIPGAISDGKAYQIYRILKEFQDKYMIGNSYTAVLNFFLMICVRMQEDVKIKDKYKASLLQRLIDNITFVLDITELEHIDFYKSMLQKNMSKGKKNKREYDLESLAEQAKDKHIEKELDKIKEMQKQFDSMFDSIEYAKFSSDDITEDEKRIMEGYRDFIAENKDWKNTIADKLSLE